jgi:hypothetical protein
MLRSKILTVFLRNKQQKETCDVAVRMSEIVEKVAAVEVKCMSPFGLTIASVNY